VPPIWQVFKNRSPKVFGLCANARPALGCPSYLQDLGKTEITLVTIISSMFSSICFCGGSVCAQHTVRMLSCYYRSGPQLLPGAGLNDPYGAPFQPGAFYASMIQSTVQKCQWHTLRTSSNITGVAGWWQHPLTAFTFRDNLHSQQRFISTGNTSVVSFECLSRNNTPNTSQHCKVWFIERYCTFLEQQQWQSFKWFLFFCCFAADKNDWYWKCHNQ